MGIVMMGTIMLIATMMVEIAVDLMSIQTTALNVNALKLTTLSIPHHMMQDHKVSKLIHCVANVKAVLPFYNVKYLCSGGWE